VASGWQLVAEGQQRGDGQLVGAIECGGWERKRGRVYMRDGERLGVREREKKRESD